MGGWVDGWGLIRLDARDEVAIVRVKGAGG